MDNYFVVANLSTAETTSSFHSQNKSNATSNFLEIPVLTNKEIARTIILSLIFLISLIANLCVLVELYRQRNIQSNINTLILHLAAADILVTVFCGLTDAIWTSTVQWYAGDIMCRYIKFIQVFALYLSTYVIVVIGLDRCAAVIDPLRHSKEASTRTRCMIITVWIVSFILGLPQAYIFRVEKGPFEQEYYQCVTFGAYTELWQEKAYMVLTVVANYLVPLVVMVVSYLLIVAKIIQNTSSFQTDVGRDKNGRSVDQARRQIFHRAKVRSIRMTALIVVVFIICWTPYQVNVILNLIEWTTVESNFYTEWIFCFGMTNSMFNPIIYGAFHFSRRRRHKSVASRVETHI